MASTIRVAFLYVHTFPFTYIHSQGFLDRVTGRFGDACGKIRHALAIFEALDSTFPLSPTLDAKTRGATFAASLYRAFYLILAQTILWVTSSWQVC